MKSQDLDDWQLPLLQSLIDRDQPSTSRRRTRDEAGPSERHIQLQIEPCIPQFSLLVLQLENKALVIMLDSKPTLSGSYQMMFEGCFENSGEKEMVSRIFGDGGHHFWLQGPLNLLTREQRANYITAILLHILEFLSV